MQTTSPSLIGRENDLESLVDALAEARSGLTRTVVVSGEAGIGKTRLVAEFLAAVPGDTLVLRGQCVDLDRDAPPYAPVVAVLRALVAAVGAPRVREAAGAAADALGVLLPELEPAVDDPAARGGADRLFDAVAAVLGDVSGEHPLVVVVEDLHWADSATLALLRFLMRVLESARVLFVVTYRSDELGRGHPLRSWVPELDRNRRVSRRELPRLNRRQVRQLSSALMGSPLSAADLSVVVQRTDGVPFFIEEILGCGFDTVDALPDTLRDILLARYETLSDSTQRFLRLLAAGGARVEHELFAVVSDDDARTIDDAAREAVQARVLVVDDTAYAFRHALVREAVHDELLPGERMRFHTCYAEALEGRQGGSRVDASAISYHWMAAHNLEAAFSASLTAMEQARSAFANSTASRLGERALELWPRVPDAERLAGRSRVDLLGETAYTLRNAGESERAIALVDEALACCDRSESPEVYGRLLRDKASYLANLGQSGSVELLREALEVIDGTGRSVLRANVLGELAARLMLDALFVDAVRTADDAFAEAEQVGSKPRMSVAANIRGFSKLCLGRVDEGLADLRLAGELAVGNQSAELRHQVNLSDAMYLLGRFDDAVRIAEAGAERARERGVERTSGAILLSNVVAPLFALGQTERAEAVLDRALELDPPIGFSAHLQRIKLEATLWSGDQQLAERLLRSWRSALGLQLRIDAQSRLGLARVAAEIALAGGDVAAAWRELAPLFAPGRERTFPPYDLPLLATAARVVAAARAEGVELGEGVEPDELEQRVAAWSDDVAAWPTAPAYLAVIAAETGGERGRGDDCALWEEAVAAAGGPGVPAQLLPYARVRLAEALAGASDRAAARVVAEQARLGAEAIGLGLVVRRVDDLERRVGLVRPPGGPAAVRTVEDDLTERERQVLDLLAQGLSNRQIAETLFISTKTASVHVSNILRKTNTATRTEAAFLARSFTAR
ncbi:AAA family ATPase [Herbiconiux sp. KACC 21604]|uniref:helix-turn-helix transcriptional regulator n=1 Tax=unclassified Herbiconiux TaxID=2618217 RepID=UPI0014909A66|nr:AAA family ATPase [Herbiconiux sp. SALV-R1]QJU53301.1 AAA family ATPase [Herbiconiux sp. SALV-R1]WPO88260.1 AAA family ATPase [Herbiconiux sp. KACC 21604]